MKHVDEFIDFGSALPHKERPENEAYARWVLNHFRLSAMLKGDFEPFMKDNLLFCKFEDKKYRVTGASRLGDMWITENFDQKTGYQKRVDIDNCSNWSKE